MLRLKSLIAVAGGAMVIAALQGSQAVASGKFRVLYTFTGGSDGWNAQAGLVMDRAGNLYGTTLTGGTSNFGVVFKVAPDGTETVLHAFTGTFGKGTDGANPSSSLVFDRQGNLYGTAQYGGVDGGRNRCRGGCGVLFKLASDGSYTVLHAFHYKKDGHHPTSGLTFDGRDLVGVTLEGGKAGCGALIRSSTTGDETASEIGGCFPNGPPRLDAARNIFIPVAGSFDFPNGAVMKIASRKDVKPYYVFQGGDDGIVGALANAGLIFDSFGNLYGTTAFGGGSANCKIGCGIVFKITPDGTETVLHRFVGEQDGAQPMAGLVMDSLGNLYGTTEFGGRNKRCGFRSGCGTVFKIAPDGTETILHAFQDGADGGTPVGYLILDKRGNLYGATPVTVFVLKTN